MENRLSSSAIIAKYDAGHQNLAWEPSPISGILAGIDLQALLANPNAADIVPELPVQALYFAIKQKGAAECLELLALLSQEQLEHMLDYEVWREDKLVPQRLFKFLKPFAELGSEQLYQRFSELDEEYQLAALHGYFKVYEVESAFDLSPGLEDRTYAMPCQKVFYEILSENAEEHAFIEELMEAAKEHNLRYAYALLGHASHLPPAEMEAQAAIFRRARLEEDGFVSFEESLNLFRGIERCAWDKRWLKGATVSAHSLQVSKRTSLFFIDEVFLFAQQNAVSLDELFLLHQNFLYLANALCTVAKVEPDEVSGIARLFEQGKALVSLGLEYLAQGSFEEALKILRAETIKILFQIGLSLVDDLRQSFVRQLLVWEWPHAERLAQLYRRQQWGRILLEVDQNWVPHPGLLSGEILKGLFNRFPMVPGRTLQDQDRIVFSTIYHLEALEELRHSIMTLTGYMQLAYWTRLPLSQPLDLIVRQSAITQLQAAEVTEMVEHDGMRSLLLSYQQRLLSEKSSWYHLAVEDFEGLIDAILAMVKDDLHGLIILPKVKRSAETYEGGLNS